MQKVSETMQKSKVDKKKGVLLIADELYVGRERKDIVQDFTKRYGLSESAVDKWIKAARIIVEERRKIEEEEKRRLIAQTTEGVVKELGLELKNVLAEYKKIAFFDIREIFTVDGGLKNIKDLDENAAGALAGVESYDVKEPESGMILGTTQKVKVVNKVSALDSICKILGYAAPVRANINIENEVVVVVGNNEISKE